METQNYLYASLCFILGAVFLITAITQTSTFFYALGTAAIILGITFIYDKNDTL